MEGGGGKGTRQQSRFGALGLSDETRLWLGPAWGCVAVLMRRRPGLAGPLAGLLLLLPWCCFRDGVGFNAETSVVSETNEFPLMPQMGSLVPPLQT